jgi:hypothetical protein
MTSTDPEPVESHDLPDHPDIDRVVIYPNDDPNGPPFEAVPFYLRMTFEDGREWYDEPLNFEVTPEYREAVAEHADVRIEDVKLTRELETFELDPL